MSEPEDFGLIVVGDEVLRGRRRDRHFDGIRALLHDRGYLLAWFTILPDDPGILVARLHSSMAEDRPVFCCGGIGATPDDHTRQCAAEAAGVPLQRHPGAAAEIEAQFGEEAYPTRIRMAELPAGSRLIPNPANRIPGFALRHHYFLPGFPEMAHPMAEWVLNAHHSAVVPRESELSLKVYRTPESRLVGLMEEMVSALPGLKMFSLPRLGEGGYIELGFRGRAGVGPAFAELQRRLRASGIEFVLSDVGD